MPLASREGVKGERLEVMLPAPVCARGRAFGFPPPVFIISCAFNILMSAQQRIQPSGAGNIFI